MSFKAPNNITYSEKNWNEVISTYDLRNQLEIVIKKEPTLEQNQDNVSASSGWNWATRSIALAGLLAVVGNLPVQSHLLATADRDILVFEINPIEVNNKYSETISNKTNSDTSLEYFTYVEREDEEVIASEEFQLPKRALETYQGSVNDDNTSRWTTYHVKSYDNSTNIFHKIGHQDKLKTLESYPEIYKQIKALKKGSIVRANTLEGELNEIIFTQDSENSYVISKIKNIYKGTWKKDIFEVRQAHASFKLENGLFFDGKKAGIATGVMRQFVKVFDWDIDFSHDIRVGDKVTVVYEEIYHDGDRVANQHLLAAEFINRGREFRTIRYTNKDGKADYFTPQGREMKKAFIRTPIAHARVSSHFNPGRFHPKLHKIRAHKGTDFAARRGTPIMTTGNGVIKSLGRKGGYGRTIVIQHRDGYTTTYAHMSRYKKKLRVGSKVYQGDVIGYVGSSGLATGSHLHYEFHKNEKAVNPMTVSLPNSMSLSRSELQDFRNKAINLVLQLNVLHRFVEADIEIDSAYGG